MTFECDIGSYADLFFCTQTYFEATGSKKCKSKWKQSDRRADTVRTCIGKKDQREFKTRIEISIVNILN